jgi:hypothetical protein
MGQFRGLVIASTERDTSPSSSAGLGVSKEAYGPPTHEPCKAADPHATPSFRSILHLRGLRRVIFSFRLAVTAAE